MPAVLAWPEHWLKASALAYETGPDTTLDDLPLVEPVKDFVQRVLKKDISLYERALYHLRQRDAFFGWACDQFSSEQESLKSGCRRKVVGTI